MSRRLIIRFIDRFFSVITALLLLTFGVVAIQSLQWRPQHDTPLFLYMAYLIDHWNYLPYRDFFDVNMPGVHLFHLFLGRVFGYEDFGLRCADLLYLCCLMVVTSLWMKKFGWRAAILSVVVFGLAYLRLGSSNSLQRDFLLLLPVSLSLFVLFVPTGLDIRLRACLIGFLFGVAATVKPHAILGLPLVVGFLVWQMHISECIQAFNIRKSLWTGAWAVLGLVAPIGVMILMMLKLGILVDFLEIAKDYWPLYGALSGLSNLIGLAKLNYQIKLYFAFGGFSLLLVPAVLAGYLFIWDSCSEPSSKGMVILLGGLAITYSFYVLIAGKFWPYHWMPFAFFTVLLTSTCLAIPMHGRVLPKTVFPRIVMLLAVVPFIMPPGEFLVVPPPKAGRVDAIAAYLSSHLKSSDTVQPLDWTGGALHAMLKANAKPATPFLYDVMFYHHISQPYNQTLRKRFLDELHSSKPTFIIEITSSDKPWVSGYDTTKEFPELHEFIRSGYAEVLDHPDYKIYRRLNHDP